MIWVPQQALSNEERQQILATCNQPQYAALPPGQIVPDLADQGELLASEASFYRVLHAHGQAQRRGRARPPQEPIPVPRLPADGPNQLYSWDITTPHQRHSGHAVAICQERAEVYERARERNPRRWSRTNRCWSQPDVVWINRPSEGIEADHHSAKDLPLSAAA